MTLKVFKEFTQHINNSKTNIGWNNFDANVKNGYKFKPQKNWQGLYFFLYFKTDNGKIIMTTDNTLADVKIIDDRFEEFFIKKRGTIDKVEISNDFKILKYKTWNSGKISDWIDYR